MPKDICHLSKRRINQLISQTVHFQDRDPDIYKNNDKTQDVTLDLDTLSESGDNIHVINAIEHDSNNEINIEINESNIVLDTVISSANRFHNSNLDLAVCSSSNEMVDTDIQVYNNRDDVYANINVTLDSFNELASNNRHFINDLRLWVVKENISQRALNRLLEILRAHGHKSYLPRDARSIMQTPKRATSNITEINNDFYVHFGIRNGIKRVLNKYFDIYPNIIKIQINCDGISMFKSSNSQFWPILVLICTQFRTDPFIAGTYYGSSKPSDANIFLAEFVNEMIDIQRNGIYFKDQICKVVIEAIICDAPARAFITYTKGHGGYFGCNKCIQEGVWKNCVVFPEWDNALRTDESFRNKEQIEHHKGVSILEQLNIGMVSQIPIDYMHLVCLGVMKRLLHVWLEGPRHLRLREDKQKKLSEMLINTRSEITYEFARLPRTLKEHRRWKATEFRQFLLYLGPILLKNILHKDYYIHFLTLSIAIRILCHSELCLSMNDYAYNLLLYFISHFSELYGVENMTYNVHNLIHLSNDVKVHGCLDKFSCFPFENYLKSVRQKIKHSPKPLEQLVNRLHEENSFPIEKILQKTYPIVHYSNSFRISRLEYREFIISSKKPNNWCLTSNNIIILVTKIVLRNENVYLCGNRISNTQSFFFKPCDSRNINILVTDNFFIPDPITIAAEEILTKCLKLSLPDSEKCIIIPLIHHRN